MRRLARRFILASSSILFLGSLVAAFFILARHTGFGLWYEHGNRHASRIIVWNVGVSASGAVGFSRQSLGEPSPSDADADATTLGKRLSFEAGPDVSPVEPWDGATDSDSIQIGNFRWGVMRPGDEDDNGVVLGSVPLGFVSALLAVYPTLVMIQFMARRRRDPGRCAACGYDLWETPGRCPECGMAAAEAAPGVITGS